ncbi:MAG TPA: hypothetical protein VKC63_07535 [Solirubrobacterales bacterium]|nr:hypothetical protein [Solirubrobacterales bacterium]
MAFESLREGLLDEFGKLAELKSDREVHIRIPGLVWPVRVQFNFGDYYDESLVIGNLVRVSARVATVSNWQQEGVARRLLRSDDSMMGRFVRNGDTATYEYYSGLPGLELDALTACVEHVALAAVRTNIDLRAAKDARKIAGGTV